METILKVLLIEDNRIESRQIQHWVAGSCFELECVENLALGLDRLAKGGIDVVILDLNLTDSRGVATFDKLYDAIPQIPIVVLTGESDAVSGSATVLKGAQDYLVKEQSDSASLVRVLSYAVARHRSQLERTKESQHRKTGRVIGFWGSKGGVGTTTTALNVAVALAKQGKSVILAEMLPSMGTLVFHLRLQPARNLRALLAFPLERLGQQEIKPFLCKGPAGVSILFGPGEDEEQDFQEIDPQKAEAIIRTLSQLAEFVILDFPTQPSAATHASANLCHFAAVITEREPGSVRAGRSVVKQLKSSGLQGNCAGVVVHVASIIVNRTIYTQNFVTLAEIQSQLGCETYGQIPWGATQNVRSLMEGVPLVLLQPDHDAALSYIEIANRLSDESFVGIQPGFQHPSVQESTSIFSMKPRV